MSQETPCIGVCFIDPTSDLCFGCGRTLNEIAQWPKLNGEQRLALMRELPSRMAAAGLPKQKADARKRV